MWIIICATEDFKDLKIRPQFLICVAFGSSQLCNNIQSGGASAV